MLPSVLKTWRVPTLQIPVKALKDGLQFTSKDNLLIQFQRYMSSGLQTGSIPRSQGVSVRPPTDISCRAPEYVYFWEKLKKCFGFGSKKGGKKKSKSGKKAKKQDCNSGKGKCGKQKDTCLKAKDPCAKPAEKPKTDCAPKTEKAASKKEKKAEPCKTKKEEKKAEPKKEAKKADPCKPKEPKKEAKKAESSKKEDLCKKKEDKKKEDPCKKKEDPGKKKEDPCKKKEDPCKKKEDPCKKKEDPCKKKEDPGKKKEDPCKKKEDPSKKKEDPCKKKEDPCKKKEDPCKKKEDPSKKKEDPCKKKEDPCKKKEDPCKKKEDPCKKKEDPCKKKEDPCKKKEDPCKKKEDPCKKKEEDPCKKKEDPCKKKEDPCKKKEDPCKKKEEDPCKKKEDPCKKKEDPCKKKEDPCKKKEDPCKKKEEDPCKKKEDPCKKKEEDPCKKKEEDPCKKKEDPCKKADPCGDKCVSNESMATEPILLFSLTNSYLKRQDEIRETCKDPCAEGACEVLPGQDEPCGSSVSWKIKVNPCRQRSPSTARKGKPPSTECIVEKKKTEEAATVGTSDCDSGCGLIAHPCGKKICPNRCEVKKKKKFSNLQDSVDMGIHNIMSAVTSQAVDILSMAINFASQRGQTNPPSRPPSRGQPGVPGSPQNPGVGQRVSGIIGKIKGFWNGPNSAQQPKQHPQPKLTNIPGRTPGGPTRYRCDGLDAELEENSKLPELSTEGGFIFVKPPDDDFEKCEDNKPPCPVETDTLPCPKDIETCQKMTDEIWSDIDDSYGYEKFPFKQEQIKGNPVEIASLRPDDPFANNQL